MHNCMTERHYGAQPSAQLRRASRAVPNFFQSAPRRGARKPGRSVGVALRGVECHRPSIILSIILTWKVGVFTPEDDTGV